MLKRLIIVKALEYIRGICLILSTNTASVKPGGCRIAAVILFFSEGILRGKKDKSEEAEPKLNRIL